MRFKATKPNQVLRSERWADGSRKTPMGTRRLIECRIAPSSVTVEDMATGQPAQFSFTERGQAVEIEMMADGYRVIRVLRAGAVWTSGARIIAPDTGAVWSGPIDLGAARFECRACGHRVNTEQQFDACPACGADGWSLHHFSKIYESEGIPLPRRTPKVKS